MTNSTIGFLPMPQVAIDIVLEDTVFEDNRDARLSDGPATQNIFMELSWPGPMSV